MHKYEKGEKENMSESVTLKLEGLTSLREMNPMLMSYNCNLYNYLSNFPHFIGFPACPLVK